MGKLVTRSISWLCHAIKQGSPLVLWGGFMFGFAGFVGGLVGGSFEMRANEKFPGDEFSLAFFCGFLSALCGLVLWWRHTARANGSTNWPYFAEVHPELESRVRRTGAAGPCVATLVVLLWGLSVMGSPDAGGNESGAELSRVLSDTANLVLMLEGLLGCALWLYRLRGTKISTGVKRFRGAARGRFPRVGEKLGPGAEFLEEHDVRVDTSGRRARSVWHLACLFVAFPVGALLLGLGAGWGVTLVVAALSGIDQGDDLFIGFFVLLLGGYIVKRSRSLWLRLPPYEELVSEEPSSSIIVLRWVRTSLVGLIAVFCAVVMFVFVFGVAGGYRTDSFDDLHAELSAILISLQLVFGCGVLLLRWHDPTALPGVGRRGSASRGG